ncbi:hypothetical protein RND81_07G180200 [Saponaria officinalis]|uniref:Transmembrane protein n=1 Tax=Saponaria officinalis TaxID=3572 RepID=A0AAW1JS74_SAPOF
MHIHSRHAYETTPPNFTSSTFSSSSSSSQQLLLHNPPPQPPQTTSSTMNSSTTTTTTTTTSQSIVDIWCVITESKRIINAHSRHFLALSVLFLLPLSFSLAVFPTLLSTVAAPSPNHIHSLLRLSDDPSFFHLHPTSHKTLIFSSLFLCFTLFFFLLAVAAVTSSVYHGFYGRPVKVLNSIRSILSSFLPLLGTLIVFCVVFGCLGWSWYRVIGLIEQIVGEYGFSYNSPNLIAVLLIGVLLLGINLYVFVSFSLVHVIVVVEGKWGFTPFRRSQHLVRGMRWVALMLIGFFGFFEVVVLWVSMVAGVDDISGDGWSKCGFVLRIVTTSTVLTLLLLHSIAATTVLYMYCKALHGELAGEIAHEFATEYVSLPFDEKKVPHVVCYVC